MLVQYPAQAPGRALDTGAWSGCPPHCSPGGSGACLPLQQAGVSPASLLHLGGWRMPLCHARAA